MHTERVKTPDWSKMIVVRVSLSLTLLFEGNNELPGFHIMSQEELLGELLHLGGHIQVFALDVRGQRVLEAERDKRSLCFKIKHPLTHKTIAECVFYPQSALKVSPGLGFLRTSTRNSCISSRKVSALFLEKKAVRSLRSSSPKACLYNTETPGNGS